MYKKILIFGDTGMLGSVLLEMSKKLGFETFGCSRSSKNIKIDIQNHIKVNNILEDIDPDLIINTVGITDVDYCEENPTKAWEIHSNGTYNIYKWINKKNHKKMIYISTDQYFAYSSKQKNSEVDPISIVNVYAKTKFLGEYFVSNHSNHLVLRTNIIGLSKKKSFSDWVISGIKKREKLKLFCDYNVCSIDVYSFSEILFDLVEKDLKGTFNLACSEVFSKKDIISEFSKQMGIDLFEPELIKSNFQTQRCINCGLDVKKIEKILNKNLPTLSEVVTNILKNYNKVYENK